MTLQPWPFNKLCEPTPADWGVGMTVCIVSHCYGSNSFVAVTDSMLSMSDMSADKLAIKSFAVGGSWMCMFSANDMSPVVAISNSVRGQVAKVASLEEVVAAFQQAFRKELVAKAESSILAPFNMTMTEFRQSGLASFGSEIFSRMFYQIEQLSLDATFLVYGFEGKKPHIFTIQNKGEVSHFDQPGFWAIGSGQTTALSSLFSLNGESVCTRVQETILYLLCKAKFSAETAPGVGRKTTAVVLENNTKRFLMFNDNLQGLRKIWEENRPPDSPPAAGVAAEAIIKAARKAKLRIPKRTKPAPKLIGEGSVITP